MDIAELTALPGARSQGTNLHHALMLANRFFRRNPTAQPVLLIVTDGEPTAHLEPDGEAYFDYPPAPPHTIAVTVQELDAAMRLGSQITFFRLGGDPGGLERFLDELARRVEGRVVAPPSWMIWGGPRSSVLPVRPRLTRQPGGPSGAGCAC